MPAGRWVPYTTARTWAGQRMPRVTPSASSSARVLNIHLPCRAHRGLPGGRSQLGNRSRQLWILGTRGACRVGSSQKQARSLQKQLSGRENPEWVGSAQRLRGAEQSRDGGTAKAAGSRANTGSG